MAEKLDSKRVAKLSKLQRSGCQDKIAWSRLGTVASIDHDSVKVTHLRCIGGDDWGFSPASTLKRPESAANGRPFQHLSWSPSGADVAAVDEKGDIAIFATNNNGTFASVFDSGASVQSEEMDPIVGLRWLNPEKPALVCGPATRNTSGGGPLLASYNPMAQNQLPGPYNPTGRQGLVAITKRGVMRLIVQISTEEARYYEIQTALETQPDLLTHATIKGTSDALMVATFTLDGILKVYKVFIEWKAVAKPNANPQQCVLPSSDFATPTVKRVLKKGVDEENFLTHMLLIPYSNELYLVFSSTEQSIVKVYDLVPSSVSLHSNFYQIAGKREEQSNEQTIWNLKLKNTMEKDPLLKVEVTLQDQFVHFCTFNNQIELVPKSTATESDQKAIYSLLSVGYHIKKRQVSEVCISPNLTGYVVLDKPGELELELLGTDDDYYKDETKLADSIVALAHRNAVASAMVSSHDDLLWLMKQELKKCNDKAVVTILLEESHRAVHFHTDVHKEYPVDKLLMTPAYQRIVTMQMVLGTHKNWERDAMGRMAWGILNVRLVSFAIAFTLRTLSMPKQASLTPQQDYEHRANQAHAIIGLVRWACDLLSCAAHELYVASLDPGTTYFEDRQSVPVCLLMAKVPRMLLLYCLRGIRGMEQLVTKHADLENNPLGYMEPAKLRLKQTIVTAPVNLINFEKVLTDIDTTMKSMFNQSNEMTEQEHQIMFHAKISKDHMPALQRTIEVFNKNTRPEINIPVLHFYDTSWLKIQPGTQDGSRVNDNEVIDQVKKYVMSLDDPKTRYRACTRCGILSQYDDPIKANQTQWGVAFSRNCFCAGSWYRP